MGQWDKRGRELFGRHECVCGLSTYLARIGLLLGVNPHVRQQFVLGVEGRQLPRAVLQNCSKLLSDDP